MRLIKTILFTLILGFLFGSPSNLAAQQTDDFDKLFDEMMKEFFPPDLRKKIESIREKDADARKPRSPSFYKNNREFLELKQRELQSRRMDQAEKQHPSSLEVYRPISSRVSESVVAVFANGTTKKLAYATVIADGLLVTKADRLQGLKKVTCQNNLGKSFFATVIEVNPVHDLAVLKTTESLRPVRQGLKEYDEGTFLVSVGNSPKPLAMGALAVKPRSIIGKDRGFLGVEPGPASFGVRIQAVTEGSAAKRAGILANDIVTAIDRIRTGSVAQLVRAIGSKKQGDVIRLAILRNGKTIELTATLDGRNQRGERAARFEMMRRLGAVLSRRNDEFPHVFEHDTPILPNQCGSPLVDLDQNVVGINIARAGRTSSYALPIDLVNQIVSEHLPGASK